jgi:hypothetical protein
MMTAAPDLLMRRASLDRDQPLRQTDHLETKVTDADGPRSEALGCTVTAEGVETVQQFAVPRALAI